MVRERKKITMRFLNSDYKAFEEQLEMMAKKGWMLERLGKFTAYYKSINPKEIKFTVDIFPNADRWKRENKYEVLNYRHKCEEKGWHYIASKEYIQCFYAEEGKNTELIHPDSSEEGEIIKNVIFTNLFNKLKILVVMLGLFVTINSRFNYRTMSSFLGVWSRYVYPLVVISYLGACIYNVIKYIRTSKLIKKGISISRTSYKWAKIRASLLNMGVAILSLSLLLSLLIDCYYTGFEIFPIILGIIIIGVIITYLNKVLKENDAKNSVKIIVYGGIIVVSFFIFIVVNVLTVGFSSMNKSYDINKIPNDYRILRIQNLDSENCDDTMEFSFDIRRSPVIPKAYIYFERTRSKSIWVEYYKAISWKFAKTLYEQTIDDVVGNRPAIKGDKNKWDADEVYLFNSGESVILFRDKEVIYVNGCKDKDVNDKIDVIKKLYNQ